MEIGLKRKTGNCAVPNAAECFLFTAQFNGEVLNAELPALGGVNGVGGEGDKGEGGKGLGCIGRGTRCSVGGRKFGVTAALDPTQLCAESALCVCVSPPPKKTPTTTPPKNPTWNYKEAMIGRFPNLWCVKEFGSGNESNKPSRKNR